MNEPKTESVRIRLVSLGCALASLLVAAPSWAQNNYRDTPIGGRSATMGGAATAAGNDSAMPFLNPAGLAAIPGDVLALSGQVYTYSRWKVDRFFAPDGYGFPTENPTESFSASRVGQLPSSVMYMKHFGEQGSSLRGVVAMALITPSSQSIVFTGNSSLQRPEVNGGLSQGRNIEYTTSDTYIGPSAAFSLGDRLNVGLSVFYLYSTYRFVSQQSLFVYDFGGARTTQDTQSLTINQAVRSIVPIVGAQFRILEGLKAGLGLAVPSLRISGRNDRTEQSASVGKESFKDSYAFKGEAYAQRPLRINAGLAYEKPKSFAVAFDTTFHASAKKFQGYEGTENVVSSTQDDVTRNYNQRDSFTQDALSRVDFAVGGEIWFVKSMALRLGAYTNGAPADLKADQPYSLSIRRFGITAGLGVEAGSFESAIGVVYQRGTGSLNAPDFTSDAALKQASARFVPVPITEDSLMFIVSGVVTTEEAKATMEKENKGGFPGALP